MSRASVQRQKVSCQEPRQEARATGGFGRRGHHSSLARPQPGCFCALPPLSCTPTICPHSWITDRCSRQQRGSWMAHGDAAAISPSFSSFQLTATAVKPLTPSLPPHLVHSKGGRKGATAGGARRGRFHFILSSRQRSMGRCYARVLRTELERMLGRMTRDLQSRCVLLSSAAGPGACCF